MRSCNHLWIHRSIFLTNVSLNSLVILVNFKNSSSSQDKLGSIWAEACLTTVTKLNTWVVTPEVRTVICTSRYPTYGTLFLHRCKKTSVNSLASRYISFATIDRVTIYKVHVFLQGMMHKSNSLASILIIVTNLLRLILKPLNLISSNTVVATLAKTIVTAGTEKP